MKEGRETT